MKIRRFQGANVRNVLGQVREALGPDAVILSNRRDGAGVEIVAATDYDEASVWQAAARPEPGQAASPSAGDGRGCGVSQAVPEPSSPGLDEVREELSRIKSLLEERIDGLSWRRWLRHHPQHRAACQELAEPGPESGRHPARALEARHRAGRGAVATRGDGRPGAAAVGARR